MSFACIFVPDFPVEALLRAEPELRSQAVAVLEGKAPLQKVFAVNEKARRAALLDCAQSSSPRVEDAGCDTVLLDLAGLETLFGPLPKIARAVARRASNLGLEANVAMASNPDTAVLAARGFSGVTVIPEGKEAEKLGSLPVEVLFAGGHGFQPCRTTTNQSYGTPEGVPSQIHDNFRVLLETFSRWGVRNLRDRKSTRLN